MNVRGIVRDVVAEILELDDHELEDGKKFTEYDFDSLLGLDILSSLEKKFKIRISEDDFPRLVHVDATVDLVESLLPVAATA